uniref:Uncharacterized protein n=1 Tax=Anopheles melas TaxID=34690 RepID=A0A182TS64_9DIPT
MSLLKAGGRSWSRPGALLRWVALCLLVGGGTVADPTVGDPYTNPFAREDDDTLLCVKDMGCLGSKDRLSKEDMDFLKSHTRYDESTIKEWYKGFKPHETLTDQSFVCLCNRSSLLCLITPGSAVRWNVAFLHEAV